MEEWNKLADEATQAKVVEGMKARNFNVDVVENKEQALEKVIALVPEGASVMNGFSTTLIEIGFVDYLKENPTKYNDLHVGILDETDPVKQSDLRRESILADYFFASPNAVTEDGIIVAADKTGSRTGSFNFAAGHLVLVMGSNKITKDFDSAIKRVREFVVPLEDQRAMKAYGSHTSINKWAIIEGDLDPQRIHVIIVKEKLGY